MRQKDVLTKLLDKYLESNFFDGAFYINGKWGTGKTKFIRDYIDERNNKRNNSKNIYISLNGVSSKDQINTMILAGLHPKLSKISKSKIGMLFTSVLKSTTIGCNVINFDLSKIKLPKFHDINKKDVVLYFDDLERCLMNVCETLGYINQFVEQGKIKTVILGNDLEIKNYSDTNKDFQEKLIAAILVSNKEESTKEDELLKGLRSNVLFDEKKKEITEKPYYEIIKEKVIEQQYDFFFDKCIVLDVIFKCNQVGIYQKAKSLIDAIIEDTNCSNIRTYKYAQKLISYFFDDNELEINDEIKVNLIGNIIWETIRLKCPNLSVNMDLDIDFSNANNNDNRFKDNKIISKSLLKGETIYLLESIRDFVFQNELDKSAIKKQIEELTVELRNSENIQKIPVLDSLIKSDWDQVDDDYLYSNIEKMIQQVKNNQISICFYMVVIDFYYKFKVIYHGSIKTNDVSMDDLIEEMKKNILTSEDIIENIVNENFPVGLNDENRKYRKTVLDTITHRNYELSGKQILNVQKELTYNDIKRISRYALKEKRFLSKFNMDELVEYIKTASNQNLVDFKIVLKSTYHDNLELFVNDLEVLEILSKKITELLKPENGIVKNKNLSDICRFLNYCIDIIKKKSI